MTDDDSDGEQANVVRVDFKRAQRSAPSDPLAPQKFAVFSRFVAKGKVMVTLDARRPGVSVPSHLAPEPQLNLDFSERFGLSDFIYDERGVRASLSFNRQPFFCDVPWSAVYALFSHADNERITWSRALPQEILAQLPEASVEHLERVLELQVERLLRNARELHAAPKPVLALEQHSKQPSADEDGDDKPPRGPGGLRLVK